MQSNPMVSRETIAIGLSGFGIIGDVGHDDTHGVLVRRWQHRRDEASVQNRMPQNRVHRASDWSVGPVVKDCVYSV